MGLREMANAPVESMRYGGLFWFTDLTLPDQFFALPIITSLTMWITIEVSQKVINLYLNDENCYFIRLGLIQQNYHHKIFKR